MRLACECAIPCPVEHSRGTCTAVPMAVDLCSTMTLWNMLIYWDSLPIVIVHTYSQLSIVDKIRDMTIIRSKRNPLT